MYEFIVSSLSSLRLWISLFSWCRILWRPEECNGLEAVGATADIANVTDVFLGSGCTAGIPIFPVPNIQHNVNFSGRKFNSPIKCYHIGMLTEAALANYYGILALTSGAVGSALSDTTTYPYLIRSIIPKKYYSTNYSNRVLKSMIINFNSNLNLL